MSAITENLLLDVCNNITVEFTRQYDLILRYFDAHTKLVVDGGEHGRAIFGNVEPYCVRNSDYGISFYNSSLYNFVLESALFFYNADMWRDLSQWKPDPVSSQEKIVAFHSLNEIYIEVYKTSEHHFCLSSKFNLINNTIRISKKKPGFTHVTEMVEKPLDIFNLLRLVNGIRNHPENLYDSFLGLK